MANLIVGEMSLNRFLALTGMTVDEAVIATGISRATLYRLCRPPLPLKYELTLYGAYCKFLAQSQVSQEAA